MVWADRVVGRQPNTGNRSYYHTDLLGSTRAVVQGATVVESYDFDPWGLLMPGRTLGSGTKEGFTGKEQDTETGLEYFGARYYMVALGRWSSVDPMADADPEWSPYNYVLNNPLSSVDPTGLECKPIQGGIRCTDVKPEDIKEISTFVGQDLGQFNGGGQTSAVRGGCTKLGNCTQSQGGKQESLKHEQALIDENANTYAVATGVFGAVRGLGRAGLKALVGAFFEKEASGAAGAMIPSEIRFAQQGIASVFRNGEFAGQSLETVANGLRSGIISPNQLPITVVVRDGVAYTLNNRSLMALRMAGLEPTVINNVTGNAIFEAQLTERLAEMGGSVVADFVPTIRP